MYTFDPIKSIVTAIQGKNDKIMPLAAIWVTDPVPVTANGRQCRITEGTQLKVVDNKIVDLAPGELPTHIVTSCMGNVSGSILIMGVMNLKTQELSQIKF